MHVVLTRLLGEGKQIPCSKARNSSWFRRISCMASKNNSVSVALLQMRCTAQPRANLNTALALVEKAAKRSAQIVCLPELFRSLYFCQTEDHANFDLAEKMYPTVSISSMRVVNISFSRGFQFERRISNKEQP